MRFQSLWMILCVGIFGGSNAAAQDPTFTVWGDALGVSAPVVEIGVLAGRDGVALGPSLNLGLNPFGRKDSFLRGLGFYAYAGVSSISGYKNGDGVTANLTDRTLGVGVDYRAISYRHLTLGAFAQAAYYGSKVHAHYFDPDYGTTVQYRDSEKDPIITVGPEIRYGITPGITLFVRPGMDFGGSFASTTAGGFSANGGGLFDLRPFGKVIAKGFHKLAR